MSSKNLTRSLARLLALLLGVAFLALACGEPPTKALEDAENSLLEAASVSECAEEEFRKAEEALAKAKQLVEEGEYDEAAIQAAKAKQLADNAKAAGEANWDDCQKAKNPPESISPSTFSPVAPSRSPTNFWPKSLSFVITFEATPMLGKAKGMSKTPTSG